MLDTKTPLPEGYKPGLEGVVAGTSDIAEVDSKKDALIYRGYAAHDLAENSTYEEVAYLLFSGRLPSAAELNAFKAELKAHRALSQPVLAALRTLPKNANPMAAMRLAVDVAALHDPDADRNDAASSLAKAKRLVAFSPAVVAAIARLRDGRDIVAPHPALDHAANFLYMVTGEEPNPEIARVMDATMIMYAEHGYNASTFSALVTASTLSDMHSAVASAIGALKGPLHGGANEAAIEMLLKIGDPAKAEPWLKDALARKEKIMGFGHRVYKHQDSRAPFMKILAEKMARRVGDTKLFDLSVKIEEAMRREKNLFPNVDYHCAVVYYLMRLPTVIYTPMFGMARMAGWTAHVIEQHATNRLIRPECIYTGPRDLIYTAPDKRS